MKTDLMGEIKSCYLGFAKDRKIRWAASSGGAVTALLLFLLKEKLVDGALVVQMDKKNPLRAETKLAYTARKIIRAKGSKYQPVDFFAGVKEILATKNQKLAVVGLPCHLRALIRLSKTHPELKKKIFLRLGLFCGSGVSFNGTRFLLKYLGFQPEKITGFSYRGRGWPGKAMVETGRKKDFFSYPELVKFFNLGFFVPPACFACHDFTNESADISFGDAWLPEVMKKDKLGTNVIIARTTKAEAILKMAKKKIYFQKINPARISEAFWWRLASKKGKLSRMNRLLFSVYRFNSRATERFPNLFLSLPRPFWRACLKLFDLFYAVFWRLKK